MLKPVNYYCITSQISHGSLSPRVIVSRLNENRHKNERNGIYQVRNYLPSEAELRKCRKGISLVQGNAQRAPEVPVPP